MNNLVMTIEKKTEPNEIIDKHLLNNNKCLEPKNKKVSFNDNVETKYVDNYIKDMNKILISKKDLTSALNIIKLAIIRKSFLTSEIKIVIDFYNQLNKLFNN
tara:strand:- start:480 stop:785 length:306 start_codon:yes stop_codon:yes gene_type:complete